MLLPYYSRDGIVIYHADCRDVLPTLAAGSVDLVLTDPPYGVGAAEWDRPVAWEADAARILAPSGYVVAFGLLMTLAPICSALMGAGLEQEAEMVWSRGTLGTAGDRFGRSHELFAVYHKPPRSAPRVDRVRVPYAPASKPSPSHRRHGLGASPGSIWYVHETSGSYARHEHETQKPLPLFARLVMALSDPGDVVLDPFMGSGTTVDAARQNGRAVIACETDERYCEIAALRLSQGVLPLVL